MCGGPEAPEQSLGFAESSKCSFSLTLSFLITYLYFFNKLLPDYCDLSV